MRIDQATNASITRVATVRYPMFYVSWIFHALEEKNILFAIREETREHAMVGYHVYNVFSGLEEWTYLRYDDTTDLSILLEQMKRHLLPNPIKYSFRSSKGILHFAVCISKCPMRWLVIRHTPNRLLIHRHRVTFLAFKRQMHDSLFIAFIMFRIQMMAISVLAQKLKFHATSQQK